MTTAELLVDLDDSDDIVDAMLHRQALAFPGDDFPWEMYRVLRERNPVFRSSHGMWVVTRYRDALTTLRHPNMDLGERMRAEAAAGATYAQVKAPTMLYLEDPADTMRQRRLMRNAFTRSAVQRLRPETEEMVDARIEECAQCGTFDILSDFADRIPVSVVCGLLGVPRQDIPRFREWTRLGAPSTGAVVTQELIARANEAYVGLRDYMTELVADRRKHLGEDLLSAMIRASDEEETISNEELVGLGIFVLGAGSDTTTQLITGAVKTLCRFPEQMEWLRGNLDRLPDAIEELLRHSGPVHYTQPRRLRESMQLDGVEIPAGEIVLASVAGANRDPDQFGDPDVLDLTREDVRHLGFSQGLHLCIGAMLARLEGEIALTKLLRRFGTIELETDPVTYVDYGPMRGIAELRISTTLA